MWSCKAYTVNSPISGHPWELKKVSVGGTVHLRELCIPMSGRQRIIRWMTTYVVGEMISGHDYVLLGCSVKVVNVCSTVRGVSADEGAQTMKRIQIPVSKVSAPLTRECPLTTVSISGELTVPILDYKCIVLPSPMQCWMTLLQVLSILTEKGLVKFGQLKNHMVLEAWQSARVLRIPLARIVELSVLSWASYLHTPLANVPLFILAYRAFRAWRNEGSKGLGSCWSSIQMLSARWCQSNRHALRTWRGVVHPLMDQRWGIIRVVSGCSWKQSSFPNVRAKYCSPSNLTEPMAGVKQKCNHSQQDMT